MRCAKSDQFVPVFLQITSIVIAKKTNPSDVTQLYNSYTATPASSRPPAWLLQRYDFMDIMVQVRSFFLSPPLFPLLCVPLSFFFFLLLLLSFL